MRICYSLSLTLISIIADAAASPHIPILRLDLLRIFQWWFSLRQNQPRISLQWVASVDDFLLSHMLLHAGSIFALQRRDSSEVSQV